MSDIVDEGQCPLCSSLPPSERPAFRASLDTIPLKEAICDACEMAFWGNLPRTPSKRRRPRGPLPEGLCIDFAEMTPEWAARRREMAARLRAYEEAKKAGREFILPEDASGDLAPAERPRAQPAGFMPKWLRRYLYRT